MNWLLINPFIKPSQKNISVSLFIYKPFSPRLSTAMSGFIFNSVVSFNVISVGYILEWLVFHAYLDLGEEIIVDLCDLLLATV